jgi:transposase
MNLSLREAAWVLRVSFSVLNDWNGCFDAHMKSLKVSDRRGKASKITAEMLRVIVKAAESLKGQGRRLRLQSFTKHLKVEHGIFLSRRKVREVLIANDLFAARTRKRRPRFYRSLRKKIPNALVSVDGSDFTVFLGQSPYKFNVELAVDVKAFAHTGFSVADEESSDEVIKVLEAHREQWGTPLAMLCDHGSSNLSEKTKRYLEKHRIELIPTGPSNPKGNGTDEGAFSQMKQVLGTVQLDTSSSRALARSVLEKMISIYIAMRNRLHPRGNILTPLEHMKTPTSRPQRDRERQKLQAYSRNKRTSEEDQRKIDRLHDLVRYHRMVLDPPVLKRAERSITAFEMEAVGAAENAFIKAVNRDSNKASLAYFFGILKNIQQQRDDEAYSRYCSRRYNEQVITDLKRHQEQAQP